LYCANETHAAETMASPCKCWSTDRSTKWPLPCTEACLGVPSQTAEPPRPHRTGAGSESAGAAPGARTGARGHAALAQQRQRLRRARQRRQVGRGRAGQRQQVQRAAAQPQPVARALRLEPARQRVRGLDQQELAIVVPGARGRAGNCFGQATQQPGGKPLVVDGVPEAQAAPQAGQRRLRRPAPGRRRSGGGREAEGVQLPRVFGHVRRQLGHAACAQRVQGLRRAVCASHVFTCESPTAPNDLLLEVHSCCVLPCSGRLKRRLSATTSAKRRTSAVMVELKVYDVLRAGKQIQLFKVHGLPSPQLLLACYASKHSARTLAPSLRSMQPSMLSQCTHHSLAFARSSIDCSPLVAESTPAGTATAQTLRVPWSLLPAGPRPGQSVARRIGLL